MASLSGRQDSAAGDLIPGISSRLGAEIIRHGIIIGRAGHVDIGKAKDFRFNQCSAVGRVIESYQAADLGSLTASADPGCGLGVVLL